MLDWGLVFSQVGTVIWWVGPVLSLSGVRPLLIVVTLGWGSEEGGNICLKLLIAWQCIEQDQGLLFDPGMPQIK